MRLLPDTDSEREHTRREGRETTDRSRRVIEGAEGGLVATLVMTAYRFPISRDLPPTALFWAEYVAGGDPGDHPVAGLVLHLLYGTSAGALFGGLVPTRARSDDAPREEAVESASEEALGVLRGVGYATVLSVFGERVVLNRVLGQRLDAGEALVFHVGHLVYGLALGTWVGSRASDGR